MPTVEVRMSTEAMSWAQCWVLTMEKAKFPSTSNRVSMTQKRLVLKLKLSSELWLLHTHSEVAAE